MKRVAVDMDGVLVNVYSQFIKMHAEDFGEVLPPEAIDGKPEGLVFPNERKHLYCHGFFSQAPVMDDCQRILARLNEKYQVFIVSAAMEFPHSLPEKLSWLQEHLPFITWKQIVFCGSKDIIRADILIDDHFKNLDYFTGETYLYTQPHNKLADARQHKRVDNWLEIEQLLLP